MMRPEIIVPVMMGAALMWWIGRGMSIMARLVVTAVTLALIAAIVAIEGALH